ncbi:MAG: hypothetical protein LBR93_10505 [Treponema sp.]|jgi:hypothetical protein|nr:hypothetical protein [Treponema sp.]
MKSLKRSFFLFVLASFTVALAVAGGIFFSRPPALVLSDLSFDVLYGPWRGLLRQAEASLRLFRPVKKVVLAENAGSEMVIFALEDASSHPWAVLAPYRYARGLRDYAEQHPETPVVVLGGRENIREGQLLSLAVDTRLDSYRAGRSAAFFSRGKEGEILVFQEERDFPVNRDAFLAGLRAEDCDVNPLYMSGYTDYTGYDKLSCVVVGSNAQTFLSRSNAAPVILFSWLDPVFFPENVRLVFDDSPWGVSVEAFRAAFEAGGDPVPSDAFLPFGRIEQAGRIWQGDGLKKIKAIVKEGFAQ